MDLKQRITDYSLRHYKSVTIMMVAFTLALGTLIPLIKVDTDPENMLSADEPVRLFHNQTKEQFALSDIVVVGIVNNIDPNGVFNPSSLARIHELTEFAKELRWTDPNDPNEQIGVIEVDLLAPSTVDHIGQGGPGVVTFEWLMKDPPKTQAEALEIKNKAMSNPLLKGTIVSEDGKAICLYLPLTSKDLSHDVYNALRKRIPIIDLWIQAKDRMVFDDTPDKAKAALTWLGRLIAQNADDLQQFKEYYRRLPVLVHMGKLEGRVKLIDEIVTKWERDAEHPAEAVVDLDNALAEAERQMEMGVWLERLHIKSLGYAALEPHELAESVRSFSREVDSKLGEAKGQMVDNSMTEFYLRQAEDGIQSCDEEYHITGLPVAEDTFGVEMFIQMAISAPLAMLVVFILMLIFFRKLVLVISPMIVAMVSVISTMGLLIGLGYPVHIMSSMIPIFLMPIAVVDSVHILSEFFDLYTKEKGRRNTILEVMGNLFMPMLYTSLTSAAGFASLALTPIPPVQVFGVFVAIGIMIAWVCTITFVPAYIMMIKESSLENFGLASAHTEKQSRLGRLLSGGARLTYAKAKPILLIVLIATAVAVFGITRIEINDNPVKWFSKSHPIRKADIELNDHFSGTYMAYLVLDSPNETRSDYYEYINELRRRVLEKGDELKEDFPKAPDVTVEMEKLLLEKAPPNGSKGGLLEVLVKVAEEKEGSAPQAEADVWYELIDFFELEKESIKPFKQPEVLRYIDGLQRRLEESGLIGKSSSVADVVKKVHQELINGKPENYRIPDTSAAVAQCLMQFQSSHKPADLWHLVTTDYMHANIWMQLPSGDNKDMEKLVRAVDDFFRDNPPPAKLNHNWAGLTYINTVWQNKMVRGMLQSFMGSFIIVFVMMAILFRSPLWGIVCMVPLLITIVVIYGIIGLVGKDYDMPVAVLSALTLGMAVDFAIHFLERARASYRRTGSWQASVGVMFGEPARAISRNVLVIAIGFLPLLAAPLVPYKTVGIFLCAIMALSGAVTLLALPAILKLAERVLFGRIGKPGSASRNCALCVALSAAAVLLVALNVHQYAAAGWSRLAWLSIITIPIMALICGMMSRRQACKMAETQEKTVESVESSEGEL